MRHEHQIARARERYGVDLSLADLVALAAQCRENRAPLLRYFEAGEHRLVCHAGVAMIVVYDRIADRIVTFLPPHKGSRAWVGAARETNHKQRIKRRHGGRRFMSEGRRPELDV